MEQKVVVSVGTKVVSFRFTIKFKKQYFQMEKYGL